MRRFLGQAARRLGSVIRGLLALMLGSLVLAGAGFAVLAWRLAEHPIDLPQLAARIERDATAALAPGRPRIGTATLAWAGFHDGLESPIAIQLGGVALREPGAAVTLDAPRVTLVLELGPLLRGHLRPRSVTVIGARIALGSDAGAADIPLNEARIRAALLGLLAPPDPVWRAVLGRLRRIDISAARLTAPPGVAWDVERLDAVLSRARDGAIDARADVTLAIKDATTHAILSATALPSGAVARVTVDAIRPRAVAALWPAAEPVAMTLDAPIDARAMVRTDAAFRPVSARLDAQAGPGTVRGGSSPVALVGAHLAANWVPGRLTLDSATAELRPRPDRPPTHLALHGIAQFGLKDIAGTASLDLDRLALDDLGSVWPAWAARDARQWTTENVTAGVARDGHVGIAFVMGADGSDPRLSGVSGHVEARGLTVHWLRPIPPVEHAEAQLRILGPDSLRVDFADGREGGLMLRDGGIVITGLTQRDQIGAIRAHVEGTAPDTLALLSQPRLHLLAKHPIPLIDPRGQVAAEIAIRLPLIDRVTMDQIGLQARAHLSDVHLGDLVAGHALDDGVFDLAATADGLTLNGTARLAAIPARLTGALDFRVGPAGQIQQRFEVSGRTTAAALAAAGLDSGGLLAGPIDLSAVYARRRSGGADIDVRAALDGSELSVPLLGWRKAPGKPAEARARLVLDAAGRLSAIEAIDVEGDGLAVRGRAVFDPGGQTVLELDRVILGGTDGRATIRLLGGDRAVEADVSGPRLDLSGRFSRQPGRAAPPAASAGGSPGSSAWTINARFDSLVLARGLRVSDPRLHAEGAGAVVRSGQVSARTGPSRRVDASVTPGSDGRLVRVTADDGGALLRDLGALKAIEGGRLSLLARYRGAGDAAPLHGRIQMDGFRVRGAPVLAKLLQAATIYGLVPAIDGPGMEFDHLAASFELADGTLAIDDARAFNPSLGLTAKGKIDFAAKRLDLSGTIVPAYYLNTALGRIPVLGRLFSPEEGGGVIAARYSARGELDDPVVRVNPLSALTPGFLRGLFGR